MLVVSIICISKDDNHGRVESYRSVSSRLNEFRSHSIDIQFVSVDHGVTSLSKILDSSALSVPYREILNKDSGLYNAMNLGINSSKGDFIIFLNAGDVLSDLLNIEQLSYDLQHAKELGTKIICTRYCIKSDINPKVRLGNASFKNHLLPLPLLSHQALVYNANSILPYVEAKGYLAADHLQWLQIMNGEDMARSTVILSEVERIGRSNHDPTYTIMQKLASALIYRPTLTTLVRGATTAFLFILLYRVHSLVGKSK